MGNTASEKQRRVSLITEGEYYFFLVPLLHSPFTLDYAFFFVVHGAKVRRVVDIGGPLPPHRPDHNTLGILEHAAS